MLSLAQTYLQSITVRLEEWRLKRRDTEEWMRHRQLPQSLQERVRRFVQYKWLATRGVDGESILRALPTDLRRDIQRHLCLDLVRRVSSSLVLPSSILKSICSFRALANVFPICRFLFSHRWMVSYLMQYVSA
jgi:cyclic nucleotide gated channel